MHIHHRTVAGILVAFVLCGAVAVHAATPIVIDNTDAGFSSVGTWPASTTVPGFQGTNYLTHEANGSPPGAIVVDNTDAGFSVTGTWPVSTSVGGYLGSNYQAQAEGSGAKQLECATSWYDKRCNSSSSR